MSLLLGMIPTFVQWLLWKVSHLFLRNDRRLRLSTSQRWRKIGPIPLDKVVLPIIYMVYRHLHLTISSPDLFRQYSAWMSVGVTSTITSSIIIGLVSQLWIRKSYPRWYNKYNYILGGGEYTWVLYELN